MSDEHTITGEIRPMELDAQAVRVFSVGMLKKLLINGHKAHWETVDCDYLFDRLLEEVQELKDARSGTAKQIIDECYDVANFAMMIADNVSKGRG
jgi:hypothetical protein